VSNDTLVPLLAGTRQDLQLRRDAGALAYLAVHDIALPMPEILAGRRLGKREPWRAIQQSGTQRQCRQYA
jgi:hypothetical protein